MAEGGEKRMLGTSEERRQRESRKRDVVERREEATLVSSMTRINKQSKREGSLFCGAHGKRRWWTRRTKRRIEWEGLSMRADSAEGWLTATKVRRVETFLHSTCRETTTCQTALRVLGDQTPTSLARSQLTMKRVLLCVHGPKSHEGPLESVSLKKWLKVLRDTFGGSVVRCELKCVLGIRDGLWASSVQADVCVLARLFHQWKRDASTPASSDHTKKKEVQQRSRQGSTVCFSDQSGFKLDLQPFSEKLLNTKERHQTIPLGPINRRQKGEVLWQI